MSFFSLRAVLLGDAGADDRGLLVSFDGRLVAVLAKLTAESHDTVRGCWFIEAAFGKWANRASDPFVDLTSVLSYIAERLGYSRDLLKDEISQAQQEYDGQ